MLLECDEWAGQVIKRETTNKCVWNGHKEEMKIERIIKGDRVKRIIKS